MITVEVGGLQNLNNLPVTLRAVGASDCFMPRIEHELEHETQTLPPTSFALIKDVKESA
jgi:hypothetical protein